MVGKTNNSTSVLESLLANASPEAQVAMVAMDDARKAREAASLSRRRAQLDKIQLMKNSADKLRDMARNVLCSSIYRGVIGSIQAGASIGARFCDKDSLAQKGWGSAADGIGPMRELDPFQIDKAHDEEEKARVDIDVEAAGHRESRAADDLAEARRNQSGVMRTLSQIEDSRHRATIEAAKV